MDSLSGVLIGVALIGTVIIERNKKAKLNHNSEMATMTISNQPESVVLAGCLLSPTSENLLPHSSHSVIVSAWYVLVKLIAKPCNYSLPRPLVKIVPEHIGIGACGEIKSTKYD